MVQFLNVSSHTQCRKSIEDSKRVAPIQELVGIAFVQCSGDEKHNVVDHVRIPRAYRPASALVYHKRIGENVRDVVKELAERFDGISLQKVELIDEDLGRLFSNCRGGNGGGFVGEEVAVVSR